MAFIRYVLIALFSLAIGFFAGYLFYDSTLEQPSEHTETRVRTVVAPPSIKDIQPATEHPVPVDLDYIRGKHTVFDKLLAAWQVAAVASPAQLESLLEDVITIHDPLYDSNVAGVLLERWTEYDPEGALRFVVNHPQMSQEYFQAHVLTSWARNDPEAALVRFREINDRQIKFAVGARLLEDPTLDADFSTAVEQILGPAASNIVSYLRIRRLPPEQAFEQALGFTSRERAATLMQAATRWSQSDPEAAVARIMALDNQQERDMLLRTVLSQLARSDPDRALELGALYAPNDRHLERMILDGLASADPVRALSRIEQYTARTNDLNPLSNLLGAWVQIDPSAAVAYASTLPRDYEWTVYQVMATRYAAAYPEKAVNWALSLPDELRAVKRITMTTVSQRNPGLAERMVDRVRDPNLRELMIQRVASRKAAQNLQTALDWVDRTTEPETRARYQALSAVASEAAKADPEQAAAIINRLPAGALRTNAAWPVALTWSSREPLRIDEIISLLKIDDVRAEQLRERARQISERGPRTR